MGRNKHSTFNKIQRNASLWTAVQASRGEDGKPDPYKAAGMAAGMGHTSLEDIVRIGAILGSQGAFDGGNSSYSGNSSSPSSSSNSINRTAIHTAEPKPVMQSGEGIAFGNKCKKVLAVLTAIAILIFLGVLLFGPAKTNIIYTSAERLIENGEYYEARDRLTEIWEDSYKDTAALFTLCEAHIDFENQDIADAYQNMEYANFHYQSADQMKKINDFKAMLECEYMVYRAEQEEIYNQLLKDLQINN